MRTVLALMNRNRKLFFKDKGMLFTSMITPVILIVLYATFLAKVFRDSFTAAIPDMITISDKLINGTVAAQLAASLMAVSCITVTFCVNLTMVQDKANGTRKDFNVSPVSRGKIYLGYFLNCQRRIWFYMWCLYADFKFWFRSSEGAVLSSEYICHFIDQESYASRSFQGDGEKTLSG